MSLNVKLPQMDCISQPSAYLCAVVRKLKASQSGSGLVLHRNTEAYTAQSAAVITATKEGTIKNGLIEMIF